MTGEDAVAFERCVAGGGVALFPADTVYGLAAEPESEEGVGRLYALKRRRAGQPAAVMFFGLDLALDVLAELGPCTRAAVQRLLPGRLTLLVDNPARRFPLACGPEPERLGLRVPALTGPLEPLTAVRRPVLQSSANLSGASDARRLADVDPSIRAGVDLRLNGGELPGTPSTVLDLTRYEASGELSVVREGAVAEADVRAALARAHPPGSRGAAATVRRWPI